MTRMHKFTFSHNAMNPDRSSTKYTIKCEKVEEEYEGDTYEGRVELEIEDKGRRVWLFEHYDTAQQFTHHYVSRGTIKPGFAEPLEGVLIEREDPKEESPEGLNLADRALRWGVDLFSPQPKKDKKSDEESEESEDSEDADIEASA